MRTPGRRLRKALSPALGSGHGDIPVVERKEGPQMIKRLFYAVLGFWLLKKYVLPHFGAGRHEGADEEL